MAKKYEVCVERINEGDRRETFRVVFRVGDVDPGWSAVLALASARLRQSDTRTISAHEYSKANCPGAKKYKEQRIELTTRQLEQLVEAVGSGDPVLVATRAADVVSSGAVSAIRGAGSVIDGLVRRLPRIRL